MQVHVKPGSQHWECCICLRSVPCSLSDGADKRRPTPVSAVCAVCPGACLLLQHPLLWLHEHKAYIPALHIYTDLPASDNLVLTCQCLHQLVLCLCTCPPPIHSMLCGTFDYTVGDRISKNCAFIGLFNNV